MQGGQTNKIQGGGRIHISYIFPKAGNNYLQFSPVIFRFNICPPSIFFSSAVKILFLPSSIDFSAPHFLSDPSSGIGMSSSIILSRSRRGSLGRRRERRERREGRERGERGEREGLKAAVGNHDGGRPAWPLRGEERKGEERRGEKRRGEKRGEKRREEERKNGW